MKISVSLIVLFLLFSSHNSRTEQLKSSPVEVGKLLINDLLSRPEFMFYDTPDVFAVHYAEACTGYGAVKLAGMIQDKVLLQQLKDRYDRVTDEKLRNTANHVDVNVYGILPIELYLQTREHKYLEQGLELADGQWKDTLSGGLTSQTRFWIDDIYMIGALQVQAYRATGNLTYINRAALEINAYIEKLQQPNGLFFHGSEAPFYWGRGNGWVAAGLAEVLSELPKTNLYYGSILDAYTKMMETLVHYQDETGMWHQLIDHKESFRESSSTAMFAYAMSKGIKYGFLRKELYTDACVKAWNALTTYLDSDGKIREVCVGTGQSKEIEYYLDRPRTTGDLHGQAPMIWLATSLMNRSNR